MNEGRELRIGYCTNVHAGADLEQTRSNLQEHAIAVKDRCGEGGAMGIGLWLSSNSAKHLMQDERLAEFSGWLDDSGLTPFTFNGFPYGNFHQDVVKHLVYQPTWCEPERLEFTLMLAEIQDRLLPAGMEGSISTLPICWGSPRPSDDALRQAAAQLRQLAAALAERERDSGRLIFVCIEPEPGCYIQKTHDLIEFYNRFLLDGADDEAAVRRHIRVCHDVCHAAVMFEAQGEVFRKFAAEGIAIGKVQVSSAVTAPFGQLSADERVAAVEQLSEFAEDRYLHQTVIMSADGSTVFFEDLPKALALVNDPRELEDPWRVHFHVPVYLESFGHLQATQNEIRSCLRAVEQYSDVAHFEVETYAWGVLPEELQHDLLADGIAAEMKWFGELLADQTG